MLTPGKVPANVEMAASVAGNRLPLLNEGRQLEPLAP